MRGVHGITGHKTITFSLNIILGKIDKKYTLIKNCRNAYDKYEYFQYISSKVRCVVSFFIKNNKHLVKLIYHV